MIFRLSIVAAALLPLASCTPPAPGAGSLLSGAAPTSGQNTAPATFGGLPSGWFARQIAFIANASLRPSSQAVAQPLLQSGDAAPFINAGKTIEDTQRALECLTAAVYYEARSESVEGQRAVAQVVLNRVRNPAFPDSICGVVYQGSERSTGCQFTFTCDGSMNAVRNEEAWERSKLVARAALAGDVVPEVGLATNYHADYVTPWWSSGLDRIAQLGTHIFYKWKGALGNALSFTQQYSGVEPEPAPGNGNGLVGNPGLMRVAVGNGMTVSIHRGSAMDFSSSHDSNAPAGVRIHRGTMSASADEPAGEMASKTEAGARSEMASKVRIHRGAAIAEAEVDPI
jgi:spore germination cell wall hydrolase CwlJ-like protein